MPPVPSRSGLTLDRINDAMRQSPAWRAFMQRKGQPLDGRPIKLSERDRQELRVEMARAGFQIPSDMEIDPAGNFNEDDTGVFEKTSVRIALAVGAGVATAGALGWGPLAGMLSSGGGSAAGGGAVASGALPSSSIAGLHAAVPGAVASQGASAGVGAAMAGGAAGAVPAFAGQAAAGGGGLVDTLKDIATDPRTFFGAAAMIPQFSNLLGGGGRGPSAEESALLDEARQGMAIQRQRIEQAQPVYDTLIRMSYGNMPTRHRGEAPAGYQAPAEQYPYAPPRFGGR